MSSGLFALQNGSMHFLLHVWPIVRLPDGILRPPCPAVSCQLWAMRVLQQSCLLPCWYRSVTTSIDRSLATELASIIHYPKPLATDHLHDIFEIRMTSL